MKETKGKIYFDDEIYDYIEREDGSKQISIETNKKSKCKYQNDEFTEVSPKYYLEEGYISRNDTMNEENNPNLNLIDKRTYTYDNIQVTVTYHNEPSKKAIENFNKGINKILHKFL